MNCGTKVGLILKPKESDLQYFKEKLPKILFFDYPYIEDNSIILEFLDSLPSVVYKIQAREFNNKIVFDIKYGWRDSEFSYSLANGIDDISSLEEITNYIKNHVKKEAIQKYNNMKVKFIKLEEQIELLSKES